MSRLSWLLDGVSGQWNPDGFFLETPEEHPPCPLASLTHAAWTTDGGNLRVVKLGAGARYECDNAGSRWGSLWPAGHGEIEQDFSTVLPATIGLEFCSRRAGLELRLDESVRLGLASGVERVAMRMLTPSPVDVVFCRHEEWTAHVDLTFADIEDGPALLLGDFAQEVRMTAQWTWKPGLPGVFFEVDGVPGEHVSRVRRRDRSRRLGIAFGSQMPSGATLTIGRGAWKLAEPVGGSASADGTFQYVLEAERAPTLSNLAPDGRLISATLHAGHFRVDINEDLRKILDWSVGSGGRYSIEFKSSQIDASAPAGERETWDFGPHQPLLMGQDTAGLMVFKSDVGGQWTPNKHPRLLRGQMPAPFTTSMEGAYVMFDSGDRRRYGVFAARHAIPSGHWRSTAYLAGKSLVCWRGLVDVCTVRPLSITPIARACRLARFGRWCSNAASPFNRRSGSPRRFSAWRWSRTNPSPGGRSRTTASARRSRATVSAGASRANGSTSISSTARPRGERHAGSIRRSDSAGPVSSRDPSCPSAPTITGRRSADSSRMNAV